MTDADFVAVMRELLAEGRQARFHATGDSMYPTVRDGDILVVAPPHEAGWATDDLLVCEARRGITVHRLVSRDDRGRLITRGDNASGDDEAVPPERVLGRVVAIERDGASIDPEHHLPLPFLRARSLAVREAMKIRPAEERFADAVRSILGSGPISADVANEESAEFLDYLDRHGMTALVHDALRSDSRLTGFPKALADAIRDEALRDAAIETVAEPEVRRVLERLADRGISALVLKGTALAHLLYSEPHLRPRSDIDLLISEADRDALAGAMTSLGYEETPSGAGDAILRQASFVRQRDRLRFVWDVHWRISNHPLLADAIRYDDAVLRSIPLERLSRSARCPDLVDLLIHACIHRVGHHFSSERLIWLWDIRLIADSLTESMQHDFRARARTAGVIAVCHGSLCASRRWFPSKSLERLESSISSDLPDSEEPSAALLEDRGSRAAAMSSELRSIRGAGSRLRWFVQLAFPPREYMYRTYRRRSTVLLPFYYLHRMARGVFRLFMRASETDPLGSADR